MAVPLHPKLDDGQVIIGPEAVAQRQAYGAWFL